MENGALYVRAVSLLEKFKYKLSVINPEKLFNTTIIPQQKF